MKEWISSPSLPSPERRTGIWGWCKINLFSSVGNTVLTLIGVLLLWWMIAPLVQWAVLQATWVGDARGVCDAFAKQGCTGACWVFIKVRLPMFMYGFYPESERWRVNLTLLVMVTALLPLLAGSVFTTFLRRIVAWILGMVVSYAFFGFIPACFLALYSFLPVLLAWVSKNITTFAARDAYNSILLKFGIVACVATAGNLAGSVWIGSGHGKAVALILAILGVILLFVRQPSLYAWQWIFMFTVFPVFAFYMLVGNVFGLAYVETHYWGGFFLTLVVASVGMATALPLGILMALGRRSELPVIRVVCVFFIEVARGVPLVSVLFLASVMFPLFLPDSVTFDKLLRALVGVAFFYAAFIAEVIRGGLQTIPQGQYEAAKALGWPYWRMMSVIILPQAIRLVIPALAINFLSLFKDTTLVAVIGLLDLLGIAKAAMADSEWLGFTKEAYVFAGVVFWIVCFSISRYSVYLEKKHHTGFQQ